MKCVSNLDVLQFSLKKYNIIVSNKIMSFAKNKYNKKSNLSSFSDESKDSLSDVSDVDVEDNGKNNKNEDALKNEKIQELLDIMTEKNKKKEEKIKKDPNSIHFEDVEFDKLEENERNALKDLFTGMPDIYKITGTNPDDSQTTINKKCAEKLKMYHPDRHSELVKKYPEEKRAKELKKLDIQFKLLRDADSILRDPSKRKFYDLQKKTTQSKNFVAQKNSFKEFIDLQQSKITEESKSLANNNFKMASLDLDKKHGFDRKKFEETPLTIEETNRRFSDLKDSREIDEIDFIPKKKFGDEPWNQHTLNDFNKMFAKSKIKDKKKSSSKNNDKSVIVWEDISAVNDFGLNGTNNYVSIDHNYEDLYNDENHNGTSLYASKIDSGSEDSESESDTCSQISVDLDEIDGYKYNKSNVDDKYNEMLNRRKIEETDYDNREMHDKESWKSVLDNPFSISHSMGTVLGGKDFSKLEGPKGKKVISKDYADVYKSLVYDQNDTNELDKIDDGKKKKKKKILKE